MNTQNLKQITSIENLIDESKAFLKNIEHPEQQTQRLGIIIQTFDGNGINNHAILYKQNNYILIVPKGDQQHARMYGNWEEALYASKMLLLANLASQQMLQVSIGQYLY